VQFKQIVKSDILKLYSATNSATNSQFLFHRQTHHFYLRLHRSVSHQKCPAVDINCWAVSLSWQTNGSRERERERKKKNNKNL